MGTKENKLLKNFISDQYSKKEYLSILNQFEDDDQFDVMREELKDCWEATDGSIVSDAIYLQLWNRTKPKVLQGEMNQETQWTYRFRKVFYRIAAVLILPLLIASLYFFAQWQDLAQSETVYVEIQCPPGMRSRFNLPDGTTGWLNGDSYLKYPVQFSKNRSVKLIGEAYFDVKKDKHSPFRVSAQGLEVEVLGTRFNVMAYDDLHRIEVTLDEGSVEVSKQGTSLNEILKPNEHLVLDKNQHHVTIHEVQTSHFTSWKDGVLEFRNVPLVEVARRLERWYNSEIIIQDDVLKDIPYRATFKNESLGRVLELLSLSAPICYEIIESKTNTNGIYEKQKVILKYKN
jgi:ferric-dicitrate binding protein FerR (iron transport regulator)